MNYTTSCIIVFAKAPIKGCVKTRLARDLDEPTALALYRNFAADIIHKVSGTGYEVKIFFDPPNAENLMSEWLGNRLQFFPQNGVDLGCKMADAFGKIFDTGFERAVLVGTDFPDLPANIVSEAVCALKDHESVIGPTFDGGYYLIGFRRDTFSGKMFEQIPWGTETVYAHTIHRMQELNTETIKLPQWRDIDVLDDLKALIRSLQKNPEHAPDTSAYLEKTGMMKSLHDRTGSYSSDLATTCKKRGK